MNPSITRLWSALALAATLAPAVWAEPFTVNHDGTVTDQATGLVWDQCAWGQSGSGCATGGASTHAWVQALGVAMAANNTTYKSHSDWRLPNLKELESLIQIDKASSPAINTTAFPNAPGYLFWSSTSYAQDPVRAWRIEFYGGYTGTNDKSLTNAVRLVRSGQSFAFFDALPDTTPPVVTGALSAVPGTNGTSASATVTMSEDGMGYWQAAPAADPAPDAATLLAQGAAQQVGLAAGVEASIAINGLTKGTAYVLYFVARDGAGNVQASVASAAFTTPQEPAAPTGVTAVPDAPGSGAVQVAWTAPADNGSAITGYTVSPNPNSVACTASPCTITGLANAAQHSFTVTATNGVGTGAAGASAAVWLQGAHAITFLPQTVASRSFAPGVTFAIAPTATVDSGQPLNYGSQNAAVCTVEGTTVTMVSAGSCTLTVNQAGDAAWAAALQATQSVAISQGVNSITFPAQPGRTFATGGTFAINPAATGLSSAPVVYTSLTGSVCSVAGSTVTMASAGTCTIAANQAGDANWSAAGQQTQAVAISATAPGAPTNVQATPAGTGAVTVSWTPPADDGGGITQYSVTALVNGQPSGQSCTATPPATSCTVTGLQNGVTYTFSVQAENGAGSAAAPTPTNPATPLADAKAFSAPSPTGTGTVGVAVAGGGASCAFESVQLLSAASAGAPGTRHFPHGVLDFVLHACDATPVTVTVTYPQGTPLQGAQYWKRQGGAWAPFTDAALGSNTAVLTLVDGGAGDDDGVPGPNGRIVDPGGVSMLMAGGPGGAAPIPGLNMGGLALLALLMGGAMWMRRAGPRRR